LNNPRLLERIKLKQQETFDCQVALVHKRRRAVFAQIRKVTANREEKGHGEENEFKNWDARQCSDYLQYKKFDTDGAMPKNVGPLRARCKEVMGRVSPTVSPHTSDDEASMGKENENCVVQTDMRELSEAI